MKRFVAALAVMLMLGACASPSSSQNEDALGQVPTELAFAQGPGAVAAALIADTLVANSADARCAGDRIAGQLTTAQMQSVERTGSVADLNLSSAEASKLVDAIFDCGDPREGVTIGLSAAGLDATTAACIGSSIDLEVYSQAMVHSFSDGNVDGLKSLAAEFDRATAACR